MIYLDHHAASPVSTEVCTAMAEVRASAWGNPSSVHTAGRAARQVLEKSRERVAEALQAKPGDVVLTAGGTEACNLAVLGLSDGAQHFLTTTIEHPAIREAVAQCEAKGARVSRLSAPGGKPPTVSEFVSYLDAGVDFVAMQWVNHEVGTLWPIASYAEACKERGIRMVVDGTQAPGKVDVALDSLGVDAVALAATKLGGPAGAGALWVKRSMDVASRSVGGSQERGRRAGTPDVVALHGFGEACARLQSRRDALPRIAAFRDRLESFLVAEGGVVNGAEGPRVATVTNVSFEGARGSLLVAALDLEGLCVSSGAACSSGLDAPSPVLLAMYPEAPWRASSALRLSLGPSTSESDVARALEILGRVLGRRAKSVN